MSWWNDVFGGAERWAGREWNNVRPWLPEIGLGAAAIAAPFLAPEIAAGAGALFGGEAAVGAGEAAAGLGAADLAGGGAAASLDSMAALGTAGAAEGGSTGIATALGAAPDVGLGGIADAAGSTVDLGGGLSAPQSAITGAGDLTATGAPDLTGQMGLGASPSSGVGDFTTTTTPAAGDVGLGSWEPEVQAYGPQPGGGVIGDMSTAEQLAGTSLTPSSGAPPTPTAAGSSFGPDLFGGGGGVLGSSVSGATALRYGIPLAGLGYMALRGERPMPQQGRQSQAYATAEGNFGEDFLRRGETGQLTPYQMSQLQIMRESEENRLRQAAYNSGQGTNSSMFILGMQQIDEHVMAATQQFIDAMIRQGLSALGQATTALNQLAQLQFQADQSFQQTLGRMFQAFGLAVGGGTPVARASAGTS